MAKESKYLQLLPDVFRQDGEGVESDFTDRFLKAFEKLMTGRPEEEGGVPIQERVNPPALEELLDNGSSYFDPERTPSEFLKWLGSWVALDLDESEAWMGSEDFAELRRTKEQLVPIDLISQPRSSPNRTLIGNIAVLYRARGTKTGMEEFIRLLSGNVPVTIREFHRPFQVGVTSTVGMDTMIGERPYYFQVEAYMADTDARVREATIERIRWIVEREKPAHTYFDIVLKMPVLQVGFNSTVGVSTLIGGTTKVE